jgi:hypothetical protein
MSIHTQKTTWNKITVVSRGFCDDQLHLLTSDGCLLSRLHSYVFWVKCDTHTLPGWFSYELLQTWQVGSLAWSQSHVYFNHIVAFYDIIGKKAKNA